ncbi:MAG: RusA family crossover junction endodeoxyribonuclease [Phycisphaeraceae bacterium]
MVATAFEFDLPFPPSVNHYWRMWRGRMVISKRGRAYRESVRSAVGATGIEAFPIDGLLRVRIEAFPPDRRRRDLDNLLKAVGDSLEHAGVYRDDSQIVWLLIEKAEVVAGGMVRVTIKPFIKDQGADHDHTA